MNRPGNAHRAARSVAALSLALLASAATACSDGEQLDTENPSDKLATIREALNKVEVEVSEHTIRDGKAPPPGLLDGLLDHRRHNSELTIIGHWYSWYHSSNPAVRNGSWNGVIETPANIMQASTPDFYASSSFDRALDQLRMACAIGIDVLTYDYEGADAPPDQEGNFVNTFLPALEHFNTVVRFNEGFDQLCPEPIRFFIFYSQRDMFNECPDGQGGLRPCIPLDDTPTRQKLQQAFNHFTANYFSHPYYFKMLGRPAVQLWLTNIYTGPRAVLQQTFTDIRNALGNPYIIGDEFSTDFRAGNATCQDNDDRCHRVKLFDAITSYGAYCQPSVYEDLENPQLDYIDIVKPRYIAWHNRVKTLPAHYSGQPVKFFSVVNRGYNDTHIPGRGWDRDGDGDLEPNPVLDLNKQKVKKFLRLAQNRTDAVAGRRVLFLSTFNEWFETTAFEPSVEDGYDYPWAVWSSQRS